MSTANRVIKNTMYLYIRMGASIIVSIFTTRILLQALGASDYGLYNVVAGALSMLGFLSASMSSATQRYISYAEGEGKPNRIKQILNTAIFLHWVLAGIVCILFIIAGFVFFNGVLNIPDGRVSVAIFVYGCLIFSTVFSITITPYDAVLNAHENMLYYSILGIIDVILKLLIAIAILFASWDKLLFYGLLMAVESWLMRTITKFYCIRSYQECKDINWRKYSNRDSLKEMSSFAGWNMLNISSGMISLYGMNIVINHYFGTLLNAAMGIANQLAGVMLGVSSNMTKAMTPVLVKNEGAHDREKMLSITFIGCKFSFLLFSVFCIPIFFFMPFILDIWLKDVPEWTLLFCRLMIISCLIDQLFVFLYQAIQAQGDVKNYNIIRSVVNILPILITIMLYEMGWKPYWVILNWIIFKVICGGLINLYFTWSTVNLSVISWIKNVFIPCITGAFLSCIICYLFKQIPSSSVLSNFSLLMFAFILCLPIYWMIAISKQEKIIVTSLINKVIKR